jgi:hypothetical protein
MFEMRKGMVSKIGEDAGSVRGEPLQVALLE